VGNVQIYMFYVYLNICCNRRCWWFRCRFEGTI